MSKNKSSQSPARAEAFCRRRKSNPKTEPLRLFEFEIGKPGWCETLEKDDRGYLADGKRVSAAGALRFYAEKAYGPNCADGGGSSHSSELFQFFMECVRQMESGKAVAK